MALAADLNLLPSGRDRTAAVCVFTLLLALTERGEKSCCLAGWSVGRSVGASEEEERKAPG